MNITKKNFQTAVTGHNKRKDTENELGLLFHSYTKTMWIKLKQVGMAIT